MSSPSPELLFDEVDVQPLAGVLDAQACCDLLWFLCGDMKVRIFRAGTKVHEIALLAKFPTPTALIVCPDNARAVVLARGDSVCLISLTAPPRAIRADHPVCAFWLPRGGGYVLHCVCGGYICDERGAKVRDKDGAEVCRANLAEIAVGTRPSGASVIVQLHSQSQRQEHTVYSSYTQGLPADAALAALPSKGTSIEAPEAGAGLRADAVSGHVVYVVACGGPSPQGAAFWPGELGLCQMHYTLSNAGDDRVTAALATEYGAFFGIGNCVVFVTHSVHGGIAPLTARILFAGAIGIFRSRDFLYIRSSSRLATLSIPKFLNALYRHAKTVSSDAGIALLSLNRQRVIAGARAVLLSGGAPPQTVGLLLASSRYFTERPATLQGRLAELIGDRPCAYAYLAYVRGCLTDKASPASTAARWVAAMLAVSDRALHSALQADAPALRAPWSERALALLEEIPPGRADLLSAVLREGANADARHRLADRVADLAERDIPAFTAGDSARLLPIAGAFLRRGLGARFAAHLAQKGALPSSFGPLVVRLGEHALEWACGPELQRMTPFVLDCWRRNGTLWDQSYRLRLDQFAAIRALVARGDAGAARIAARLLLELNCFPQAVAVARSGGWPLAVECLRAREEALAGSGAESLDEKRIRAWRTVLLEVPPASRIPIIRKLAAAKAADPAFFFQQIVDLLPDGADLADCPAIPATAVESYRRVNLPVSWTPREIAASEVCEICRRLLRGGQVALFKCGHAFHEHCVEGVMEKLGRKGEGVASCPTCGFLAVGYLAQRLAE